MAWALVTGGNVTALYRNPKGITIGGIQHPRNIFTQWSAADLKAIGIYSHDTVGQSPDSRFYTVSAPSTVVDDTAGTVVVTYPSVDKALEDVTEKVVTQEAVDEVPAVLHANGAVDVAAIPAVDEEFHLNIISTGLKSQKKDQVKTQAAGALQGSDWMVIREAEGGTAVASAVATYRAAVRTKSGSIESAIDGAANMVAFIALYESTGTYGESDYVEAALNDWPTVPDALK